MAVRFSDEQVLKATRATRRRQGGRASFEAVCTDSRALTPGCLFVALQGERFDGHQFVQKAAAAGAGGAVVCIGRMPEGLPEDFAVYEVPDTLVALGDLARFHRGRFSIPVGAVGGSNGKTTTKEMVAAILAVRGPSLKTEGNLNNEVGVPLTLFGLEPRHVAAVVEMGMNHPGEMTRLGRIGLPDAAVITVVQPEHLEGLGSLEGVAEAEGELFRALEGRAVAVVNLDDPLIVAQAQGCPNVITFGRSPQAEVRLAAVQSRGREGLTAVIRHGGRDYLVQLAFVGEHNAQNATAAFALALALGYRADECVRGLEAARPYARRLNVLEAQGGVTVVDDCYNANPASMTAALATLSTLAQGGRAVAVLGDMLELGPGELQEHAALGEQVAKAASLVAFFGPRSTEGHRASRMGADQAAHFTDVEALVAWLSPRLQSGDVVLVKGSRGMRLERVVAALTGSVGGGGGH